MLKVFGIRHHGPGSSRSLLRAFSSWNPDCVLIELAQEADSYLSYLANPKLVPPIALLLYDKSDPRRANYSPFARFSPEYNAILWAQKNQVPVRAIDLPSGWSIPATEPTFQLPTDKISRDPLGYLAEIGGYDDRERWWENFVESYSGSEDLFAAIGEIMQQLREESLTDDLEITYREAFMRQQIRKAVKMGFERIAVVCGAWHYGPLADFASFPAKEDNELLKNVTKSKMLGTWVPWSYDMLERSAYSAGVESPQWYEHLFDNAENATIKWMSRAVRLLRREGIDASSASAIEAVRLAETLAQLRSQYQPGLDILEEAAVSVIGGGNGKVLELIRKHLVIGDVLGKVPSDVPMPPLQQDLEAEIKAAKLTKEWKTTDALTKSLDLRQANHQKASVLLHRLDLLEIPWGKKKRKTGRELGTFKEEWRLHRKVKFVVMLYSKASFGSTIMQACEGFLTQQIGRISNLPDLLSLLDTVLLADLPSVLDELFHALQSLAAKTADVLQLVKSVPPLIAGIQFGTSRNLSTRIQQAVLEQIFPRIWVGLVRSVADLNYDFSVQWLDALRNLHQGLLLLNDDEVTDRWRVILVQLSHHKAAPPLLQGYALRVLLDRNWVDLFFAEQQLSYRLSTSGDLEGSAHWLGGFLSGNGTLLIWQPQLLQIIHNWVSKLNDEQFMLVLPLLRKSFSGFSERVKQTILKRLFTPVDTTAKTNRANQFDWEAESWERLAPMREKWFGA